MTIRNCLASGKYTTYKRKMQEVFWALKLIHDKINKRIKEDKKEDNDIIDDIPIDEYDDENITPTSNDSS